MNHLAKTLLLALCLALASAAQVAAQGRNLVIAVVDTSEAAIRLHEAEIPERADQWSEESLNYRVNSFLHRLTQLNRDLRRADLVIMGSNATILYDGRVDRLSDSLARLYEVGNQRYGCADLALLFARVTAEIEHRTDAPDAVFFTMMTPGITSPRELCATSADAQVQPITLPQPVDAWGIQEMIRLDQLRAFELRGLQDQQEAVLTPMIRQAVSERREHTDFFSLVHPIIPTISWAEDTDSRLFASED